MKSLNLEFINRFSNYYTQSLFRRIIIGIIIGGSFWLTIFLFTLFLRSIIDGIEWSVFLTDFKNLFNDIPLIGPFLISIIDLPLSNDAEWIKTALNDFPGIALVIGLVLVFEIWGLIPRPIKKPIEEQNENKI